jgi:hypothetical protein
MRVVGPNVEHGTRLDATNSRPDGVRMKAAIISGALLALAACGGHAPAPPGLPAGRQPVAPTSGKELLHQMHDAYAGRWYRTLTFVQTTSFADGHKETWYEAAELPGKLRIDIAPLDSGKMSLFRNDSLYAFEHDSLVRSGPFVHPLLVLGFDIYAAEPDSIARKLAALGLDLTKLHADTWQGRPAWVVGAAAGDSVSSQFWIDAERLVFVRLIERRPPPASNPRGPARRVETRFNNYQPLGGGWISPQVVFLVDGQERLREEYHDMKADVQLPAELFSPDGYRAPGWVE